MEKTLSPAVEKSRLKLRIDSKIREINQKIKHLEQDKEILEYGLRNLEANEFDLWKCSFVKSDVMNLIGKEESNG
jgi:hypothetical protein